MDGHLNPVGVRVMMMMMMRESSFLCGDVFVK